MCISAQLSRRNRFAFFSHLNWLISTSELSAFLPSIIMFFGAICLGTQSLARCSSPMRLMYLLVVDLITEGFSVESPFSAGDV